MDKYFIQINEEAREKRWENGYFATLAKQGGGIALIICGAVLALLGVGIGSLALRFSIDISQGANYNGMMGITIFFWCLALFFLIPGALVIRFGFKRKGMNAGDWIKKSAKESGYPESVIRDFDTQAVSPGSIHFRLAGMAGGIEGILTKDYLMFANLLKLCVIKRSDITGAYLVSLPDSVSTGNKIKSTHSMNVAVFSNHKTYIVTQAVEKYGEHLIAMLTETHPGIDTAGGRVLSDKEYDKMVADTM